MIRELLNERLNLPDDAVEWLRMLYDTSQVFDDIVDCDEISYKRVSDAINNTLLYMPMNPFWLRNASLLWPVVSMAILKWHAANTAEERREPTAMSFAWRAGFFDIVLAVYAIYYGHGVAQEHAHEIMGLYGEKFEDYMKEFTCQTL